MATLFRSLPALVLSVVPAAQAAGDYVGVLRPTPNAVAIPQGVFYWPVSGHFTPGVRPGLESAAEGQKLFTSMNCDGCHGGGATGFIAPSLSDGRWRYGASDGALYQSIYYGRPQGMPAFGGVLQEPIVWKLVTYLKSLPVPAAVPTQAW